MTYDHRPHDRARTDPSTEGEADDVAVPARTTQCVQRRASSAADIALALSGREEREPRRPALPEFATGISSERPASAEPLQLDADRAAAERVGGPAEAHDLAARATAGSGGPLPHLDTIQQAFGPHDVTGVRAHTDGAAAAGSAQLGAHAFASGNDVAFAAPAPDLHTAAHEAAHVVQQRAGVHLKDGLGQTGDAYEQHADAVADAVVRGESAAHLLGPIAESGSPSVQRAAIQRKNDDATGAALLRSAATDLQQLQGRLMMQSLPGMGLDAEAVAQRLAVIIRRVDEAGRAGASLREGEIENVAGAARALIGNLPAKLAKAPEIIDATQTLLSSVGDAGATIHFQPSAEPTVSQPVLDDQQQVSLARVLLGQATDALDAVASAPPGRDEHVQYAKAAADAGSKVQVAADLISAHVPAGKARMALSGIVEGVSRRIAQVDQWVRASKLSSDRSIAVLYAHERALRDLTGLEPVQRVPLETIDAATTASALSSAPHGPSQGGTVAHVRASLNAVLQSMDDAIDTFLDGTDPKAKSAPSLADELVGIAVDTALGSSFQGAIKRMLVAGGRALVGSEGEGELPGKLLDLAWKHGEDALRAGGSKPPSEKQLRKAYVGSLRSNLRKSAAAIRQGFEDRAEQLGHAAPDSLRAVADTMEARSEEVGRETLVQYVLSWQTLKTRSSEGTPEQPRAGSPEARSTPSEHDADLAPAFTAGIAGVLHIDFPVNLDAPRASGVREGSGAITDISAEHMKALRAVQTRPVRELHLNTAIRVTYGGANLGGVEILWFPDGGTVKVNWERMDHAKQSLRDARHLQAYALGVAHGDPSLERATEADAIEGARLIAEAVADTQFNEVFGDK